MAKHDYQLVVGYAAAGGGKLRDSIQVIQLGPLCLAAAGRSVEQSVKAVEWFDGC